MNYAKAIRIARALVDMPQRELAKRIAVDSSLISMLESGKRTPSLKTLKKIADALGLPFHLLALLGTQPQESKGLRAEEIHQLAIGLAKLLLRGGKNELGDVRNNGDREVKHSQPKPSGTNSRYRRRKAS